MNSLGGHAVVLHACPRALAADSPVLLVYFPWKYALAICGYVPNNKLVMAAIECVRRPEEVSRWRKALGCL
jgi:hypothetical protein